MSIPAVYEGNEPYIFVSYSHRDNDVVLPIIIRLQSEGYRVWYDDGCIPASDYIDKISDRIVNCHIMLIMLSEHYIKPTDDRIQEHKFWWPEKEMKLGIEEEGKAALVIRLDKSKLPPSTRLILTGITKLELARQIGCTYSVICNKVDHACIKKHSFFFVISSLHFCTITEW